LAAEPVAPLAHPAERGAVRGCQAPDRVQGRIAAVKVGVVGLGTMGAGIAQVCVEAGLETVGREVTPELGRKASDRIGHFLTRKVEKGRLEQGARDEAAARLTTTTELAELADCDVVIEAIVEV